MRTIRHKKAMEKVYAGIGIYKDSNLPRGKMAGVAIQQEEQQPLQLSMMSLIPI